MSRINIFKIVISHICTFRNIKKGRVDYLALTFMLLLPAIISTILVFDNIADIRSHISDLLTFVSITGGFLFNLLALIHVVIEKVNSTESGNIVKKKYAKEIHSNISFGILVAIISTIVLILYSFPTPFKGIELLSVNTSQWFIYFTLLVFTLNLLLILKRIFTILDNP